ncbi:MAG: Wzz/FepE/Etk N-terminal domain-containing protein [bacterium]|nr:Wzz/FepE/Etk N-terminal domain-containing protein [bacterium]
MNKKTAEMNDHEIDLLDYANVIIQHRKMIIRNVIVTAIAVAIISFLLPRSYTAITTILPPEDKQTTNLLSALSNSPLSSLILDESGTTSDLYVEILKSRSVLDGVLSQEFSYPKGKKKQQQKTLLSILKANSLEKGRKKFVSKVAVKASPEGIISVSVELKDRNLAADVANALVNELDKINKEKNTSRAKNSRIYIENQLNLTEKKLKKASEDLVAFQEKYKAISLEDQTKIAIEKAGELKGRIVAKNVELGVSLQTMKSGNVNIVQLKKEIEELEKQYNFLQYGDSLSLKTQKEFYIPFANVPEVGLQLAKLLREVKVQETVWELLNQQYYHAKIQEARDTPTIQALDEAVPPELRTKPKRKLLVLIGSFLALMLSIFWAFIAEYIDRVRSDTETYHKTIELSDDLKQDWQKIKSHLKIFRINRRNND